MAAMDAHRPTASPVPGRLLDEIREQPDVAARLLRSAGPVTGAVAEAVRHGGIGLVVIAARGTSDHAAVYAQYILGARNGLPVALAVPSLETLYGASPQYGNALVVGVSQSGRSPDVVGVVESARRQGVLTLAITNAPQSPLADVAEHVLDIAAGDERSVAATKTYTAELLAIAMLSAALDVAEEDVAEGAQVRSGDTPTGTLAALRGIPEALARALDSEPEAARIAADQVELDRAVVLGRGFGYATAREWSLKLKEVAQLWADPYSAADFAHGPVALLAPGSAVFASITAGPARDALLVPLRALVADSGAQALVLSDDAEARAVGRWSLEVPAGLPEWLTPIVAIVPAQLHALHLALARGLDPEQPRGLRKVTETR
jgi:glucosamine--fructose-6-phosphate aminotransferase (isomerizing)